MISHFIVNQFMKTLFIATLIPLMISVAYALPEGQYTIEGGNGGLTLGKADKEGGQTLDINIVGTNAHLCDLNGKIKNGRFEHLEKGEVTACKFQITLQAQDLLRLDVEEQDISACKTYCGSRAFFRGMYTKLPQICGESSQSRFLTLYRARKYEQAIGLLDRVHAQCSRWEHWSTVFARSNDRAITLFHLNRKSECISALAEFTRVGISLDAETDREVAWSLIGAQPTFEDIAIKQIQAARTNLKLCGHDFKK